ncbi:MAG: methyltransferase family protein [Planctomycetaceae bacterium]
MTNAESTDRNWISRGLVAGQFLTAGSLVISTRPSVSPGWIAALSLPGIALGLWAVMTMGATRVSVLPEVSEHAHLCTSGPYRWIRHPMYTALLLACLGAALSPPLAWKAVVWLLLAVILVAKARIEERHLLERFNEYPAYQQRSWRFVPFLW